MKRIKEKVFDFTYDYAEIYGNLHSDNFLEKFLINKDLSYQWLKDKIKSIKFSFSSNKYPHIIGDFIFPVVALIPYCVISKKAYKYLFIDNPKISKSLKAYEIDLINKDNNIKEISQYYILLPKFIADDSNIEGISWSCVKLESLSSCPDNSGDYFFYLNISDNFIKDFKKQKFTGITLEKYEEPIPDPENIYYESTEMSAVNKISNFLQEVSKKKILKSKCKYIYYTIIEEEKGYTLGVGGYLNKYFEEETFSFDPNMCELTNTDLGNIEWEESLFKLQNILQNIYNKNDNDFYRVKAFIGFHDSDIYNVN